MPKKIRKKKTPQIKKDIRDFLFSEEGKIQKKDIAKIGLALAVLGIALEPQTPVSALHSNVFTWGQTGPSDRRGGHSSGITHSNHSNHSSGGWC